MRTSAVVFALLAIAAIALASPGSVAIDRVVVQPMTETPLQALATTRYSHSDCIGPALPGTTGPHTTHTAHATGFVIDPARSIQFSLQTLTLQGAGICPVTAVSAPYLPQDYTGSWSLTAVCREGTLTPGQTAVSWSVNAVAGYVLSQNFGGSGCIGYINSVFAMDITIATSPLTLLGQQIPATGGVATQISQ